VVRLVDEIAAGLSVLTVEEAIPDGPDATADPVSGVDDRH
jgi:hypothetical protein